MPPNIIEPGQPVGPVIDLGAGQGAIPVVTSTEEDISQTPVYGVKMHGSAAFHYVTIIPPISPGEFSVAPELMIPISLDRRSDPFECRFPHTQLQFLLLDDDLEEITQAVSGGLQGKLCEFYQGYLEESWDDAELLFNGIISEVELDERGYRITAVAASRELDIVYFTAIKSRLQTAISASATSLTVEGDLTAALTNMVLIDTEYIAFTTKTDNGDGSWTLTGLTREAELSTVGKPAAAHSAGALVQEVFRSGEAHPLVFAHSFLNELAPDHVDVADTIEQINGMGGLLYLFSFFWTEPLNIKAFIETEILKVTGGYPVETLDGRILWRVFGNDFTSTGRVDDGDCFTRPRWRGNYPRQVNHVIWLYDWDPATKEYKSTYEYRDEGLITLYGDHPLVIKSQGLRSYLANTLGFLEARSVAWVERFGLQLPTMQAQVLFEKRLLQPGDVTEVQFDDVVNLSLGEIGYLGACDIIATRHNFQAGDVELELLGKPPIFVAIDDDMNLAFTATPTVTVS